MDNWLKNNNVLKIVSVILAVMLWMVVSLDTTPPAGNRPISGDNQNTFYYTANIVPIYNENDYVINMKEKEVHVTLRGNNEVINQIRNGKNIDKMQFFVDMTDYKPGTYQMPIKFSGFPKDVEVEIQPTTVEVGLSAKYRKEFTVMVEKIGLEAEGYQTGEPIIKPKKVHLTGNDADVEQVAFVKAYINIDNVQAPILQQIPLRAFDKMGNVVEVEINPQTVEVQIPVTSPYITVPITYRISKYPPEGYAIESLDQLTKEVTLYGPRELINEYRVYNGPDIDLSDVKGFQTIDISIPLEEGLLKTEPDAMHFEVNIVKAETKTVGNINIEVNGLGDGLKAEIVDQRKEVNITLEGASNVLNAIKVEDLQAFVDLSNLPPGQYNVPIQYNIPILTKRIGVEEKVNVLITKE